ncbi:hypothetical protein BKA57DRAFT_317603 [Linnemannia elongata]|nr:hypothetical protein BKA57DRAFT_317603 [Linnemannia elongata]
MRKKSPLATIFSPPTCPAMFGWCEVALVHPQLTQRSLGLLLLLSSLLFHLNIRVVLYCLDVIVCRKGRHGGGQRRWANVIGGISGVTDGNSGVADSTSGSIRGTISGIFYCIPSAQDGHLPMLLTHGIVSAHVQVHRAFGLLDIVREGVLVVMDGWRQEPNGFNTTGMDWESVITSAHVRFGLNLLER